MKVVVCGGGISGLAAAFHLRALAAARRVPLELTVLETGRRLGGTIHTIERDGFRCEHGPNGFLDSKPTTLALARALGIGHRLLPSADAARRRFVLVDGRLLEIPTTPPAFLRSPLLPVGGRLRVLGEMFVSRRREAGDESVAAFARRRLGRHAAERLIDPFVSGVFAGDPERLSVRAAFPRLVELEAEYGSLIAAAWKLAAKRKGDPDADTVGQSGAVGQDGAVAQGGAAGPGGRLTAFPGGMSELIGALGDHLSDAVRLDSPVTGLCRGPAGWSVTWGDQGNTIEGVDRVVLAVPAYAAAPLLAPLDFAFGELLGAIPYAAVSMVALGFRREDVAHALDGFGFLIPAREHRPILGCLWTSSIFPGHRAPAGHVLLRVMAGGARRADVARRPDQQLVELARRELEPLLGLRAGPVFHHVSRHRRAIPQYELGHGQRLDAIDAAAAHLPGLHLLGNAFRGVGINDCTREAARVASEVLAGA